jgi:hypothetical protein
MLVWFNKLRDVGFFSYVILTQSDHVFTLNYKNVMIMKCFSGSNSYCQSIFFNNPLTLSIYLQFNETINPNYGFISRKPH